jgi:hypothetical protein
MRRDITTIIIGILFLLAGVAIGGNMLGIFDFQLNLHGWWTIFIIVPALIAIAQGGFNAGNIIMLGVGVILLLNAQNVLPGAFTWRIILPVILLAVGAQLLFGGSGRNSHWNDRRWKNNCNPDDAHFDSNSSDYKADYKADYKNDYKTDYKYDSGDSKGKNSAGGIFTEASRPGAQYKTASAMFGAQDIFYGAEDYSGGSYTALFGGLTINLCNVNLVGDVVIQTTAIFGGIDIILPPNVQVISHVTPILGGTDIKYASSRDPSAKKIIINGCACFGGIDVK